jgi:hypothetical protein
VGTRTGLNGYGEKKMSCPTDFEQRMGQHVANRYTEYVFMTPAFKRRQLHFSGESACNFIQIRVQYAHFMVHTGVINVLDKASLCRPILAQRVPAG